MIFFIFVIYSTSQPFLASVSNIVEQLNSSLPGKVMSSLCRLVWWFNRNSGPRKCDSQLPISLLCLSKKVTVNNWIFPEIALTRRVWDLSGEMTTYLKNVKESLHKWEAAMFLDGKIQYCGDVTSPQIKCQIQWHSKQNIYEIVLELNSWL